MRSSVRSAWAAVALALPLLGALSLSITLLTLLPSHASSAGAIAAVSSTVSEAPRTAGKRARVVEVTDGDSIKVRLVRSGAPRNVRLIGIDTPETHGRVECGGPKASRSLKRALPLGTVVRLVRDPNQDNRDLFNRLLRYVVKPSGHDVARKQLRRGWARVFQFGGETFGRAPTYHRAMETAEAADRGIWALC